MFIPKKYGMYKAELCPFCKKHAVTKNPQGIPVCSAHKTEELHNLRCACGEYLDVRNGKFGAYFSCIRCGNINFNKAMELNPDLGKNPEVKPVKKQIQAKPIYKAVKNEKKELIINSDELDFYFR